MRVLINYNHLVEGYYTQGLWGERMYKTKRTFLISVVIVVVLALLVTCGDDTKVVNNGPLPQISITALQPNDSTVRGTAINFDPVRARVILWAETDKWCAQPLSQSPYTPIYSNGSWSVQIGEWSEVVAVLVDSMRTPPLAPGTTLDYHPSLLSGALVWDEFPPRCIDFSGYRWRVLTGSLGYPYGWGGGLNFFSDSESSVWVDSAGLHLKMECRGDTCWLAEVFLDTALGFGIYAFQLESSFDWPGFWATIAGYIGEFGIRKASIRLECGQAAPDTLSTGFCYQTGDVSRACYVRYDPPQQILTLAMDWRQGPITFTRWNGPLEVPDSLYMRREITNHAIEYTGGERMSFGVWFHREGGVPVNGQSLEVTIKSFEFEPSIQAAPLSEISLETVIEGAFPLLGEK